MFIHDRLCVSLVSFCLVILINSPALTLEKKCDLLAKSLVSPIAVNAQLVYSRMCYIVLQLDDF